MATPTSVNDPGYSYQTPPTYYSGVPPGTVTQAINSPLPRDNPTEYSSGLFSCFDDMSSCCLGTFLPCYLAAKVIGENAERPGVGLHTGWFFGTLLGTLCGCVCCVMVEGFVARQRVQRAYSIKQNPLKRFCASWWCSSCTICQDYREIQLRNQMMTTVIYPQPTTPLVPKSA